MKKKSSIKKNFLYQIFYQILISLLPFVTSPYISRVLGATQIGIYTYVYSIITFFLLFANLGISNYGNRLVAKNRNNQDKLNIEFSSLYYLHLLLSFVVLFIYILFIVLFVDKNKMIFIVQMIFIVANLLDISWLFFGEEDFKSTVLRNSFVKIINCILIFVLVKDSNDLILYTIIMSLGTLLSQLILWPFAFKYISFVKVSFQEIFKHTKKMSILFVATLAVSIYSYTDKIMLGSMSTMSQLGYYENAWKMIEFPVGFITALGTVMLPKMSNLVACREEKKLEKYITKSMRISMLGAAIICFGLLSISSEFSVVFWGSKFAESGTIMKIMSICVVFMSWNGVIRSQYLIPTEKDKIYLIAVSISSIVNVIINFLLIPKIGAAGAAIGTVISYFVIYMTQNYFVRKDLDEKMYLKMSIPYFVIGLLMFLVITILNLFVEYSVLGMIFKIVIGGIVYLSLLLIYNKLFKDDLINELLTVVLRKVFKNKAKKV